MAYILKNLHFILIHVPIAMLLFSFIFDGLAVLIKKKDWHNAGLLCLVVGTLGAIGAVLTGPDGDPNPLAPTHEFYGKITMFFFIALTLVRLWLHWKKKLEIGKNPIYLTAALIGVLLVSYTGHLGGKMVHPEKRVPPNGQIRNQDGTPSQRPQGGSQNQQPGAGGRQSPNGQQTQPSPSSATMP